MFVKEREFAEKFMPADKNNEDVIGIIEEVSRVIDEGDKRDVMGSQGE
jgi:hypothetical protein